MDIAQMEMDLCLLHLVVTRLALLAVELQSSSPQDPSLGDKMDISRK